MIQVQLKQQRLCIAFIIKKWKFII